MSGVEQLASRTQTDDQILAALDLHTDHDVITLDRSDPHRIVVLGTYTDQVGEVFVGRAILAHIPGVAQTTRRWYLGCVGCECELQPEDAGFCPTCRDVIRLQGGGVDL